MPSTAASTATVLSALSRESFRRPESLSRSCEMVLKDGRAVSCMKSKESSARRVQGEPRPNWLHQENSSRDTRCTEMGNDTQLEGARRTRI